MVNIAYVIIVVGGDGGGSDDGVRFFNTDSSGDYDNDDNYTMIFALKR